MMPQSDLVYQKKCYRPINYFDFSSIEKSHREKCQVCNSKMKIFVDDLNKFRSLQVAFSFTNREKQILLKCLLINILNQYIQIVRKVIPAFQIIKKVLLDLWSVFFSIKTALVCVGAMFFFFLLKMIFN